MGGLAAKCVLGIAVVLTVAAKAAFAEHLIEKYDLKFPAGDLPILGSGSGVIIGPRLILTNRHVAANDNGTLNDGFLIRLAPGFKEGPTARVLWICKDYDLAILETSADLPASRIIVSDQLGALGTKVTAYGFPLGDQFGVGLTATGGQVTRHPVETTQDERSDTETESIKSSLWHDAVTSGGSSGGPLFSESGVLLGLHFGSLVKERHGIAVPSSVISKFLKAADAAKDVNIVSVETNTKATYDPKNVTVYIEILGSGGRRKGSTFKFDLAQAKTQIEARLAKTLPSLSDRDLANLSEELAPAFPAITVGGLQPNQVVRLKGEMTVIQVTDTGILAEIDGVLVEIQPTGFDAQLARAKLGTRFVRDIPMDSVYVVGEIQDYTTVRGSTNSYFPLIPALNLVDVASLQKIVRDETARREKKKEEAHAVAMREGEIKRGEEVRKARAELTRTFVDTTGKHKIEATIIKVNGAERTVDLIRKADGKTMTVPLAKLSQKDRDWIVKKVDRIRDVGPVLFTPN